MILVLATCALVAWITSACAGAKNYELLSFFFDGVPDPDDPNNPDFIGPRLLPGDPFFRPNPNPDRLPRIIVYFHKPWAEKKCDSCHFRNRSSAVRGMRGVQPTWMQGEPDLILPKKELCRSCHAAPEGRFIHGPTGSGDCAFCHEHHNSAYPHLVKTELAKELCVQCHAGETFTTEEAHKEFEDKDCTACHDPHSSNERYLLLESAPPERPKTEGAEGISEGTDEDDKKVDRKDIKNVQRRARGG